MNRDPVLYKATRLARSGKYADAIRTLEPEVNRYYGSFRYYYLLGVCCLQSGDFGGALTWFRLAREVKPRKPLGLLGLATLYLRRGETDKAVDLYLEAQEQDPKNRIARKALRVIRTHAGGERFAAWLESGKLHTLYPPVPSAGFSLRAIAVPALAIAAALVIAAVVLVRLRVLPDPFARRGSRSGIPGGLSALSLSVEERAEPVETGGSYRYILTGNEALNAYDRALSLFTAYRDEAAKISLNRILESNASGGLKNRARLLISFMEVPGFDSFRREDNVPYSEVLKDPALYRDTHVIWRGMATNVSVAENASTFDFLVGYDTRTSLEGIVPVAFDRALAINPDRPLEVLGRIRPVNGARGEDIRLEGVAIHQPGNLERW
jgi:tetratricopeptide (TPR) repeat protein